MESNAEIFQLGAIVWGLTEVFKELLPARLRKAWSPLIAVVIGGAANVYLNGYSPENLLFGLMLGLVASGLYKAAQNTLSAAAPVVRANKGSAV